MWTEFVLSSVDSEFVLSSVDSEFVLSSVGSKFALSSVDSEFALSSESRKQERHQMELKKTLYINGIIKTELVLVVKA